MSNILCLNIKDEKLKKNFVKDLINEYNCTVWIGYDDDILSSAKLFEAWYRESYVSSQMKILVLPCLPTNETIKSLKERNKIWELATFITINETISDDQYRDYARYRLKVKHLYENRDFHQYRKWVKNDHQERCALFFAWFIPIAIAWTIGAYTFL